jgi:hypothetical protein
MAINFSIELPIPLFGWCVTFEHLPEDIKDITRARSSFSYTATGGIAHSASGEPDDWNQCTKTETELSYRLILVDQNAVSGDVAITFFDSKTKWFQTHTLPCASIAGVPAPDLISAFSALPELTDSDGEPLQTRSRRKPKTRQNSKGGRPTPN